MHFRRMALVLLIAISPLLSGCGLFGPGGGSLTPVALPVTENPGPVLALEGRSIQPPPTADGEEAARMDRVRLVDASGMERAVAIPDEDGSFRLVCRLLRPERLRLERVDGRSGAVLAIRELGELAPAGTVVRELDLNEESTCAALTGEEADGTGSGREEQGHNLREAIAFLYRILREEPRVVGPILAGGGFASSESVHMALARLRQLVQVDPLLRDRLRTVSGYRTLLVEAGTDQPSAGGDQESLPSRELELAAVRCRNQELFPPTEEAVVETAGGAWPLFALRFEAAGRPVALTADVPPRIRVRVIEQSAAGRRQLVLQQGMDLPVSTDPDVRVLAWTDVFYPLRFDESGAMLWEPRPETPWSPLSGATLVMELQNLEVVRDAREGRELALAHPGRFVFRLSEAAAGQGRTLAAWDFTSGPAERVIDESGHGLDLIWPGLVRTDDGLDLDASDFAGLIRAVRAWDSLALPEDEVQSLCVSIWFGTRVDIEGDARLADSWNPLAGLELPASFPADPRWRDLVDILIARRDRDPAAARGLEGLENLYDLRLHRGFRHHLALSLDPFRRLSIYLDGRKRLQLALARGDDGSGEGIRPAPLLVEAAQWLFGLRLLARLPFAVCSLRIDLRDWNAEEVASVWREGRDVYVAGSLDESRI